MSEIRTEQGVLLKSIPVSPNDDYMAGEDGQIYSRTKYAGFGRKNCVPWYPLKGRLPKKQGTKQPYITVSLCHNNKRVTKSVHRLICIAFHGMPPEPSSQARHLDGDAANNRPSNLAWGSQYENWRDRKAHGRGMEGEKHHMSKLTDVEREHIRWAVSKGLCSAKHAARMLGMSAPAVAAIVSG